MFSGASHFTTATANVGTFPRLCNITVIEEHSEGITADGNCEMYPLQTTCTLVPLY